MGLGRIIAVTNQKGGVGKTTTAVNLCACLAHMGHRTLLIDMDPQSNASSGAGIDRTWMTAGTVYEMLLGQASAQDIIVPGSVEGMDVMPSTRRLVGAEVELLDMDRRDLLLKNAVQPVYSRYHFIIIDCPPALNILTLNALGCAQSVIIPVQSEYYALEGISALLETIDMVKSHLNPDLQILGVLMTMHNYRTNLAASVHSEIREFFGPRVFDTLIPRNIRLSEAPSHGLPIIRYDRRSKGALAYMALAGEVVAREK